MGRNGWAAVQADWSRPGRPLRRIGVIVVVLLSLSVFAAIGINYKYHLGVPAAAGALVVGGGAPASLYLAWESIRLSSKPAERSATLADDASMLARAVESQWEKEFGVRRSDDPSHYLSVSWTAPEGCAPAGMLVVLGGPGYGKSTLMLQVMLDLLERRQDCHPVPVYVTLSSWDPSRDSLNTWLANQLPVDYPALADLAGSDGGKNSRLADLLSQHMIAPILDGLDEMPPGARVEVIRRLNAAFAGPGRPPWLVLTSRPEEYRRAVGRSGDRWTPLRDAAVVELPALDPGKVANYLSGNSEDTRWTPVVEALHQPGTPVAQALRTPLYASLASVIYNPRDYESNGRTTEPGELADQNKFPDQEAIGQHLLDAFIPAVYPVESDAGGQRHLRAERSFMFLARYLTDGHEEAGTSLQWWDLTGLAPRWLVPGVIGTVSGIGVGVSAGTGTHVGVGIGVGLGTGMLVALVLGLGVRAASYRWNRKAYQERYGKGRPGPGMAGGLIGAAVGGLGAGVAGRYGVGHEALLFSGLPDALGIGIGAGASTDFFGGLAGSLIGSFMAGYLEGVGLGVPAGLIDGLAVAMAAGLFVAFMGRANPARRRPQWHWQVGLAGGLIVGLAVGFIVGRAEGACAGVAAGIVLAAAASLPFGLSHSEQNLDYVPSPGQALAMDATAFRFTALSAGLATGTAGFVSVSLASILEVGARMSVASVVSDGLGTGLSAGLVAALAFGCYHAASPRFLIVSWWLALRGKTPWRLHGFLEDAHERGVLRQVGAAYQFRHEDLRQRLANRAA